MTILCPELQAELIGIDEGLHAPQIGERWMDRHFNRVKVLLLQEVRQLLDALDCLVVVVVHLPVAAHDGLTFT
jgi:hypothetical protein